MKYKIKISVFLIFLITSFLILLYSLIKSEYDKTAEEKLFPEKMISGALDALIYWNEQRAFPEKDIPGDKYYAEYVRAKQNFSASDNVNGILPWENIGPNNVGGRTLTVAVNPDDTSIVWLGSASGGLWKSTTGGIGADAWSYVETSGIPILGVSSIILDPSNTNVMYIGTGETYNYDQALNGLSIRVTRGSYGMGILKSTDGGSSWAVSLDWSYDQNRGVWDIVIDPSNSNILYTGTTEGIYKSTNAGNNWTQVFTTKMVMDMEIDKLQPNIIYAGVGNLGSQNPGLYRSTDSGNNWMKLTGGLPATNSGRTSIKTYKKNPNIIITSIGQNLSTLGLYRSSDQGNTWTQMSGANPDFLSYQGWYAKCVQIKDDDSSKILAGGVGFYKSVASGSNLILKNDGNVFKGYVPPGGPEGTETYMHVDFHDIISNPIDPEKIYVAGDGGLFRSNDFGETFYGCNGGYVTTQFYAGFSNSSYDSTIALGGLQDNYSIRYNGSKTWYRTSGGDGIQTAVNPNDHSIMFCSSQYLSVYRSIDTGNNNTWSIVLSGGNANFVGPLLMCPSDPNVMYAGRDQLMKSTNGGISATWNPTSNPPDGNLILSIGVSYTNTDTVYIGTVPTNAVPMGFFRSINGGTSWTNISSGLPNRYPTDIAVNPSDSRELYAVFSGFGTPHVFKTTNSGTNWTNISGALPDIPFQAVIVDPFNTNHVYTGNDFGVYISTNGGTNWNSFNDGFYPAVMVFDLTVSLSNRKIRAVTHGNGVFERSLLESTVGISSNESSLPENFKLYQNYPNPFNPETKISFYLKNSGNVSLKFYDALGRVVSELVNGIKSEGEHSVNLNASDLQSGVYYYRLEYKGSNKNFISDTKRMVLVK